MSAAAASPRKYSVQAEGDVADPTIAVWALLKDRMGADVDGRVYRPELPEDIDRDMPETAIVVMPGGDGRLTAGTRLPVHDSILDVLCYGATRLEADEIARKAASLLKQFAMAKYEGILMYWARQMTGINPRVQLEVNWNYSEFSVQLLHSEYVL